MEFRPADFLATAHSNPGAYLIILHVPIQKFEVFRRVWAHSTYRICADGGANRLHDLFDTPRVKRNGEIWRRDDFVSKRL
jgi:thiamine pyrophosphokinase